MDILSNKWLQIEVSDKGAEMCRITGLHSQHEYLWNGDPAYWDRHCPLLFPIVGKLRNGETSINGSVYHIPKHGFISDQPFEKVKQTSSMLVYRLESSQKMHAMYPFPFCIDVIYRLRANYISVTWKITNTGIYTMPFHIGGHPGINYPHFNPNAELKAYAKFHRPSPVESASVCETGCLGDQRYDLPMEDDFLPLTDECFKNDAIIIDRNQVKRITLYDVEKRPYVSMDFQSPVLLLWSPYGVKAPFVCLEPWYGLCDSEYYQGDFLHRPYTNLVEPGRYTTLGYSLHMEAEVSRNFFPKSVRKATRADLKELE